MRIPEDKIEEIKSALDIVDVVQDYVQLKKHGSNYFGLCPFHNEKTPSFSVNPNLGIYKCFGCGAGGNVFQFVMGVENLTFVEVVRLLAARAHVDLPAEGQDDERHDRLEPIYNALRFAGLFYYRQLTATLQGEPALKYLLGRGLQPGTIKKFGIGYAPAEWDSLSRAARAEFISDEVLERAGLVLKKEHGGTYDRFRDRITFPIFSSVGKVIGFGGRVFRGKTDQPKYINSPETDVYQKSRVLYGLFQAKQAIRKAEEAILVEGYMDVITLHQAGVENVVASSGTALTPDQVKALSRYAKRILVLYDADSAGASAAVRGIDLVLEQGLTVYAAALPPGEDPDSFVKANGGEAFIKYLADHRQDFISFKYAQARRSGTFETPEGHAGAMREVIRSISRVPDPLLQETYIRRASDVLGVPDITLFEVLAEEQRNVTRRDTPARREAAGPGTGTAPEAEVAPVQEGQGEILAAERMLLRLMIEHGQTLVELILGHMGLEEFSAGPARETAEAILKLYESGDVEPDPFFNGAFGASVQTFVMDLFMDQYEPSENWSRKLHIPTPTLNPNATQVAQDAMTLVKLARVNEAIDRQRGRLFAASQRGEDVRSLQEEWEVLLETKKQIERRTFLS